jgi:hypothetical protein
MLVSYPLCETYFVDYNGTAEITLPPTPMSGAKVTLRKINNSANQLITVNASNIYSYTNFTTSSTSSIDISASSAQIVCDENGWYSILPEI